MSYLKFDKSLMINLEQSLRKEMLRTNQSGAYHCTTVVDCNTRKQHGLLVIPIKEFGNTSHVMLSSMDVTVIQHGARSTSISTAIRGVSTPIRGTNISASMTARAFRGQPIVSEVSF